MDWGWISERVSRCENKILSLAISLTEIGTSSILEIGLQRAGRRSEIATALREASCEFQTHFLNVDAEERWRRVEQRNEDRGETFRIAVNREMFDFFEGLWEPPDESELKRLNRVDLQVL